MNINIFCLFTFNNLYHCKKYLFNNIVSYNEKHKGYLNARKFLEYSKLCCLCLNSTDDFLVEKL